MDIVFDDDNARVLRSVHDELISAVEDDVVAVARVECHQGVTTTNCLGPSGEMISKFKLRVVGDGVEIVVAVDRAGQTLLDDVEERVERRECRVLGIGHDLLLGGVNVWSWPRRSSPASSAVLACQVPTSLDSNECLQAVRNATPHKEITRTRISI